MAPKYKDGGVLVSVSPQCIINRPETVYANALDVVLGQMDIMDAYGRCIWYSLERNLGSPRADEK